MIINQIQIFILFFINGILIGLILDFFRVLRKNFKTNNLVTYFEDFAFWILTGIILLYCIFKYNNGQIRLFIFFAITIGVIMYMNLFSKYFIKINNAVIKILKKLLVRLFKIISLPLKIFKRIFIKPISFIIINIRKFSKIRLKKIKNTNKK